MHSDFRRLAFAVSGEKRVPINSSCSRPSTLPFMPSLTLPVLGAVSGSCCAGALGVIVQHDQEAGAAGDDIDAVSLRFFDRLC